MGYNYYFLFISFPSLCDADKKSCLSGVITVAVIVAIIYGLSALNNLWEHSVETIVYAILALIIIVIIWATIQAFIDLAKRKESNENRKLIEKILSTQRCPYCQSKNIILPNYYGIIHGIDKQQLYCQDCGETWYYKEE